MIVEPPKAMIVFSVACFYDVDTPQQFIGDVAKVLTLDGMWVNQMNFMGPVMRNNAFDFLSHEHIALWDLATFVETVAKAGLEVFDVEELPLNGGTYRVYIGQSGHRPVSSRVADYLSKDKEYSSLEGWARFQRRAEHVKTLLNQLLAQLVRGGKTIFVYGASTRGNTLLQYCGLDSTLLPCALDRDPNKWGRVMAGTNISIISEEEGRRQRPDYFLVLPYSYLQEFIVREKEFLDRGGKFIVPLPEPRIVGAD